MGFVMFFIKRHIRKTVRKRVERVLIVAVVAVFLSRFVSFPVYANAEKAKVFPVPSYNGFKSFERGIRANGSILFHKGTKQYDVQAMAETEDGFRKVNGRYLVAVGSRFTSNIGQYIALVLDSGVAIPCIVGDQKADSDTDATNTFTRNSCCSEFIVDIRTLEENIKSKGDVSYYRKDWDSPVTKIIVYDTNLFSSDGFDSEEMIEKLSREYKGSGTKETKAIKAEPKKKEWKSLVVIKG